MTRPDIWIGTIEISWSDEKTPNVYQPAFSVVTTWAANPEEFREKRIRMLGSCGWKLLDVARANPAPDKGEFSEEVEDMLEKTRNNPNAIIYGTFYSYPKAPLTRAHDQRVNQKLTHSPISLGIALPAG
jgi:hypothetical protein